MEAQQLLCVCWQPRRRFSTLAETCEPSISRLHLPSATSLPPPAVRPPSPTACFSGLQKRPPPLGACSAVPVPCGPQSARPSLPSGLLLIRGRHDVRSRVVPSRNQVLQVPCRCCPLPRPARYPAQGWPSFSACGQEPRAAMPEGHRGDCLAAMLAVCARNAGQYGLGGKRCTTIPQPLTPQSSR